MKAGCFFKPALVGVFVLALAACDDGSGSGSDSFRKDYTKARTALEAGQYATANRIYARMLGQAGPLTPRIRLEYAHSLLRSGAYDQAAAQAQGLANSQTGTARGAALSVLGTAASRVGPAGAGRRRQGCGPRASDSSARRPGRSAEIRPRA